MNTPIVFSTDDNYAVPTAVAIKSIVDCDSNGELKFFILYSGFLSDDSRRLFESFIGKKNTLEYLDVSGKIPTVSSHISHISSATYYRILLPDLLPEYEKCLYLDGDIVVKNDLSELLNYNFSEEEWVAGVKAASVITSRRTTIKERKRLLGIDNFDSYINAGVTLMNLKALRKNNCVKRMIDLVPENYPIQDQDIINKVCFNHVKIISPKYNAMPCIFYKFNFGIIKIYSLKEIIQTRKNPIIIHYADKRKPWKYLNVKKSEDWRNIYYELKLKDELPDNKIPLKEMIVLFFKNFKIF